MDGAKCHNCGEPFTESEWEDRHYIPNPSVLGVPAWPVHADCCTTGNCSELSFDDLTNLSSLIRWHADRLHRDLLIGKVNGSAERWTYHEQLQYASQVLFSASRWLAMVELSEGKK